MDYMLSNLYKAFLHFHNRNWESAFHVIMANLTILNNFNEIIVYIKHTFIIYLILQKMELQDKAKSVLLYLRDIVEDTFNGKEAIGVYE